jgi:hypothetical protein
MHARSRMISKLDQLHRDDQILVIYCRVLLYPLIAASRRIILYCRGVNQEPHLICNLIIHKSIRDLVSALNLF